MACPRKQNASDDDLLKELADPQRLSYLLDLSLEALSEYTDVDGEQRQQENHKQPFVHGTNDPGAPGALILSHIVTLTCDRKGKQGVCRTSSGDNLENLTNCNSSSSSSSNSEDDIVPHHHKPAVSAFLIAYNAEIQALKRAITSCLRTSFEEIEDVVKSIECSPDDMQRNLEGKTFMKKYGGMDEDHLDLSPSAPEENLYSCKPIRQASAEGSCRLSGSDVLNGWGSGGVREAQQTCHMIGDSLVAVEAGLRTISRRLASIGVQHDWGMTWSPGGFSLNSKGSAVQDHSNGSSPCHLSRSQAGSCAEWEECLESLTKLPAKTTMDPSLMADIESKYAELIQDYALDGLSLSTAALFLSDAYVKIRKISTENPSFDGKTSGCLHWKPPDQFRRVTTKYWVRPEDVMRVKTLVVRHLPILIFGRAEGGDPPGKADLPLQDSSPISSIYFDNSNLDIYHTRLHRTDGASLARVRWYGMKDGAKLPNSQVFIERKRHKDAWTGEFSMKERARISVCSLPKFVLGYAVPEVEAKSAQTALHEAEDLGPVLPRQGVVHRGRYNKGKVEPSHAEAADVVVEVLSPAPSVLQGQDQCMPSASPMPQSTATLQTDKPQTASSLASMTEVHPPLHSWSNQKSIQGCQSESGRALSSATCPALKSGSRPESTAVDPSFISRRPERAPAVLPEAPMVSSSGCSVNNKSQPKANCPESLRVTAQEASHNPAKVQLLHEVQFFLTELNQEPFLRTSYERCAFQRSDSNVVRVSLDTKVCMRKEYGSHVLGMSAAAGSVKSYAGNPDADGNDSGRLREVHFPYAIVEVKLQDEDSCPAWVQALCESGLLVEAPKFSKFLHGMACLYPDRLRNTPHWFVPMSNSHKNPSPKRLLKSLCHQPAAEAASQHYMRPATIQEMADVRPSENLKRHVPHWLFPPDITPYEFLNIHPTPEEEADAQAVREAAANHITSTSVSLQPFLGGVASIVDYKGYTGQSQSPTSPRPLSTECSLQQNEDDRSCFVQAEHSLLEGFIAPQASTEHGIINSGRNYRHMCSSSKSKVPTLLPCLSVLNRPLESSNGDGNDQPLPLPLLSPTACDTASMATAASLSAAPVCGFSSMNPRQAGFEESTSQIRDIENGLGAEIDDSRSSSAQVYMSSPDMPNESYYQQTSLPFISTSHSQTHDTPGVCHGNTAGRSTLSTIRLKLSRKRKPGMSKSPIFWGCWGKKPPSSRSSGTPGGGPGGLGLQPQPSAATALVRSRIEPKTFFASERTFLAWINISVLVMFTSLSLMSNVSVMGTLTGSSSGTANCPGGMCRASSVAGMIMAPVAMALMLYALYMYKKRSYQILRRETARYDDQRGPVALVLMLLTVLITAYVMQIHAASNAWW